jgi:hypothetical protein
VNLDVAVDIDMASMLTAKPVDTQLDTLFAGGGRPQRRRYDAQSVDVRLVAAPRLYATLAG